MSDELHLTNGSPILFKEKGVTCAKFIEYKTLYLLLFFFSRATLFILLGSNRKKYINKYKAEMSEDYVEWDVHATNDALTPRVEYDDPLSQFSESEVSMISKQSNK